MALPHFLHSRSVQLGLFVAAIASVGYLMLREPSRKSRAEEMVLSESNISLNGVDYAVEWEEEPRSFEGLVRDVGTELNKFAPYRTHYVLLTTGDYSDETKVEIENKQVLTHLDSDLVGTIRIVEIVPSDMFQFDELESLEIGQTVTITGRQEKDGLVRGSNGDYTKFGVGESGRPLVLLSSLSVR